MTDVLPLLLDITELAALSLLVSLLYDTVQELARAFTRLTRPTANAAMTAILALLVSAVAPGVDAAAASRRRRRGGQGTRRPVQHRFRGRVG